jgi:ankyrin repeat protein
VISIEPGTTCFKQTVLAVGTMSERNHAILRRSCMMGDLPVVELLIAEGADPGNCDSAGSNAFHRFGMYGQPEVLSFIIQTYSNKDDLEKAINAVNLRQETPLYLAAYYGNPVIVQLLTKAGAHVNGNTGKNCLKPLIENESGWGRTADVVRYLVSIGGEPGDNYDCSTHAIAVREGLQGFYDRIANVANAIQRIIQLDVPLEIVKIACMYLPSLDVLPEFQ